MLIFLAAKRVKKCFHSWARGMWPPHGIALEVLLAMMGLWRSDHASSHTHTLAYVLNMFFAAAAAAAMATDAAYASATFL